MAELLFKARMAIGFVSSNSPLIWMTKNLSGERTWECGSCRASLHYIRARPPYGV